MRTTCSVISPRTIVYSATVVNSLACCPPERHSLPSLFGDRSGYFRVCTYLSADLPRSAHIRCLLRINVLSEHTIFLRETKTRNMRGSLDCCRPEPHSAPSFVSGQGIIFYLLLLLYAFFVSLLWIRFPPARPNYLFSRFARTPYMKAFPDWSGKVVRRRSAEGANGVPDESRKRQNM